MKTNHLLLGAAAILALAACSNEIQKNEPQINETNEIRYLRVAIANAPGTRAPGDDTEDESTWNPTFDKGTPDENAVNNFYLRFYDINGNVIESYDNNSITFEWKNNTGTPTPSVGRIGEAVVELQLKRGDAKPAYVIAFINPVDFSDNSDLKSHKNMQDLRNMKREGYKSNGGYFAMSNSAYYGPADVDDGLKNKIMATSISEDMLKHSKDEAEKSDAVEIYVERYAAKVSFSVNDGASQPMDFDGYTLTFEPEAWTVNADAKEMYVSKRFENSNAEDHLIPSYGDVQAMLGEWRTWNDATNHRSYWACSPSYYDTKFPNVSDNIIDKAKEIDEKKTENDPPLGTGAGVVVTPYSLMYYSYNQITSNSDESSSGKTVLKEGGINSKYVLENTMGKPAFESLNPKAAAPSVVVVGKYTIKKGETEINVGEGFCRYDGRLYWRGEVPENATGETILQHLMDENQILFTIISYDENDNPVYGLLNYDEDIAKIFDVIHPTKDVRGIQDIPHRYVTLQLKQNITSTDDLSLLYNLYYKPLGANDYAPLATDKSTPEQIAKITTDINKQLWTQLGNARAYNQGKGYFSIPIQHLGMTENTKDHPYKEVDGQQVLDWKAVRVGDFGLVRNHSYTIKVSEIKGWASGIEDLDNPLVPSMEDDNYWVKYKVNILNWRIVPAQDNIKL